MNPQNIGPALRELLLEVSQGLQGEIPERTFSQGTSHLYEGFSSEELRKFYLKARNVVQNKDLFLFTQPEGNYFIKSWFTCQDIADNCREQEVPLPPTPSYNPLQKSKAVLIFKELTEEQVYFYSNKVQTRLALTSRNLGEELHYCLTDFIERNPKGKNGSDLGTQSVPFLLNGKNDIYRISLCETPVIFENLTLKDIKSLL